MTQQNRSQQHHLVAYLDPGPEASERAILLLRRKNFRVQRFSLQPAADDSCSQLDLIIAGDASTAGHIRANLEKLISVRRVVVLTASREPARSLALVRLEPHLEQKTGQETGQETLAKLCQYPEVRVLEHDSSGDSDGGPSGALLEIVAATESLDSWIDHLRPLGIAAISCSAAVSLSDPTHTETTPTGPTGPTDSTPRNNDLAFPNENTTTGVDDHG